MQGYEGYYVNAWLKRCVYNLYLNWESVSESWTWSGRLFQSLGAKRENALPPLVELDILYSPDISDETYVYLLLEMLW